MGYHNPNSNKALSTLLSRLPDIDAKHITPVVVLVESSTWLPVLIKYFDKISHQSQNHQYALVCGTISKKSILIISPCSGTAEADILLNEIKAFGSTRNIIKLGTGYSLQPDIAAGSLVVSSMAIGLDNLLQYYRYTGNTDETYILDALKQHARIANSTLLPYVAEGAIQLRKYFGPDFVHEMTASLPSPLTIINDNGSTMYPYLKDALITFSSRNMRIANTDSNTAALYGIGKILGINCCSVQVIINNTTNTAITAEHCIGKLADKMMPIFAEMA